MCKKRILFLIVICFIILLIMPFIYSQAPGDVLEDGFSTEVSISGGLFVCDRFIRGYGYNFINGSAKPKKYFNTTNDSVTGNIGNCFHPDAVLPEDYQGSNIDPRKCCPTLYNCSIELTDRTDERTNGGPWWMCELTTIISEYIRCDDYKTKNECENDSENVAKSDLNNNYGTLPRCDESIKYQEGGKWCINKTTRCICYWDESIPKCKGSATKTHNCSSGTIETRCTCNINMVQWDDLCESEGYIYAKWETTGDPAIECSRQCNVPAKERQIPCDSPIKLEFFNWINFILSFLIIFVIYFYKIQYKKIKYKQS